MPFVSAITKGINNFSSMTTKNLSKDMLLSHISPIDITLNALKLNSFPNKNISSPFSEDKKPSFKVFKNGNYKCFSTGKNGDCFQLVAELNNLDCNTNFNEVLQLIETYNNLLLIDFAKSSKSSNNSNIISTEEVPFRIKSISKIPFEERHLQFWDEHNVTIEFLERFGVSAINNYSFYSNKKGKDFNFKINENEIAFSYTVNENHEIYIPKQETKDKKFINSLVATDIFGLKQLPEKVENLIICAGKKDTLVATAFGFYAITFRSETQMPTKQQIETLQSRCNNLLICYDNDNGGVQGVNRILDKYEIIQLQLPATINDIADYFKTHTREDFESLIQDSLNDEIKDPITNNATSEETTTIFHITENYLNENYDLRFNSIALEIELSKKNENKWISCNENSLWLELQKKSIKIPLNSLLAILKSDAIQKYNPIVEYFNSLPEWNQESDYITEFSRYVILDDHEDKEQFEYHFKKWCVRAVKCATIEDYFNKQAFVLTDDGLGQNIGKSSYCRFLCPPPLSNYFAEDMGDDKDSRILLCKNFLINLDELAALSKKEINQLKSYFSKSQINDRLPYDRKNSIIPRIASFIGSTNMSTFLQDETGSVRWLCFVIKSINWNYKKEFDINKLWAQALHLANDKSFEETLSFEDIRLNELRNDKFQIVSPEKDLANKFFSIAVNMIDSEFMTSTDILNHINLWSSSGIRLNSISMGKALKSIGHKRTKHNGIYGYWVVKKPT